MKRRDIDDNWERWLRGFIIRIYYKKLLHLHLEMFCCWDWIDIIKTWRTPQKWKECFPAGWVEPCQAVIQKPDSSYELWSLRAHRIFSDVHVCETQEYLYLLKLKTTLVHFMPCMAAAAYVYPVLGTPRTPPLPPPLVTKHCFWHLSYHARFHKSSWKTRQVWKSASLVASIAMHCSLMNLDQTSTISGLDLDLELLLFSKTGHRCKQQPQDCFCFLSWPAILCMIGFATERPGTFLLSQVRVRGGWEAPL